MTTRLGWRGEYLLSPRVTRVRQCALMIENSQNARLLLAWGLYLGCINELLRNSIPCISAKAIAHVLSTRQHKITSHHQETLHRTCMTVISMLRKHVM